MNKFSKSIIAIASLSLIIGGVKLAATENVIAKADPIRVGSTLKALTAMTRSFRAEAQSALEIERLVLIKSLYYFINGGPAGTWPDGASGDLTGHNAPSGMEEGFLGIMNDIIGPDGAVSEFLAGEGYTSCESLPSSNTTFTVDDSHLGELSVVVGPSTKAIPAGLTNSGNFEKRIFISTVAGSTPVAAVHLHCSGNVQTILVRADIELDAAGETERIEAISEGSMEGPDLMLEIFVNNGDANQDDLAMRFKTTDGDDYQIFVNHNSQMNDSGGNGPAHILAGVNGTKSTNKAQLAMMGGDHTNGQSASNGLSAADGLAYDSTQTPDQFANSNQFCVNTSTAASTTGCTAVPDPGTPKFTGMTDWTIDAMRTVRTTGQTVTTLNTTNY